ncbi:MAG: hypothetical protein ACR2PF_11025 [Rhizobiaceae bacterium]
MPQNSAPNASAIGNLNHPEIKLFGSVPNDAFRIEMPNKQRVFHVAASEGVLIAASAELTDWRELGLKNCEIGEDKIL